MVQAILKSGLLNWSKGWDKPVWLPGSGCEEDGIEGSDARVWREGGGDIVDRVCGLDEEGAFHESLNFPMMERLVVKKWKLKRF